MKKLFALTLLTVMLALSGVAQIVTTSPAILQEASKNVVLTYNAASPLGNNGLKGLSSSTAVYAHIGVITNKSVSTSDWKYAPTWGDNAAKYKLTYVKANTYTLNIGDLRTYFGITDASETIEKIALVFRTADNSKEGKTAAGGDIFVDVHPAGFQMQFTTDGATLLSAPTTMSFTLNTSEAADLTISVNGSNIATATGKTVLTASHKFSSTGAYYVKATAVKGGQTLTQTINVAYPGKSTAQNYPGGVPQMGAVRNSDGSVTFCLAAPQKQSVVLVPSWDNYEVLDKNIMKYQDYNGNRYFWTTVTGLKDDTWYPYYYIVDATTKVADPYAHLVLDCYSDRWIPADVWPGMPKYPYDLFDDVMLAVYRHDSKPYNWTPFTIPDHRDLQVYELLFRDFTGTVGAADANGTYLLATEKVPYLASLGVNTVELMPVMEFNGNNSWGYNTNFYMAPDKNYGSPTDLKNFINQCHAYGMAVVLDIVFNQSDGLHPWYQMYPAENNPFYNFTAPHAYSVLNDWNQKNDLVRQQWKDAIKFWMTEYNVDGFRFDLVKGLGTDYGSNTDAYNASRVAVMKDLHKFITDCKANGIHINENLASAQEENEMAADGELNWANINNSSCQYAMGFAADSGLGRFLATNDSRTAWSTVSYAESHDEQRMGYKQITYGASGIKGTANTANQMLRLGGVAVQMLMTPGSHMIWQFGELGDGQNTKNADGGNNTDPKIVVWNYLQNADRMALHDTYAAMLALRKDNPKMFDGSATFSANNTANNIQTGRYMRLVNGSSEIVAILNPRISGAAVRISTTSNLTASNYQVICASKNYASPTLTKSGTSIAATVPANGYVVFASKDIAGVDDVIADTELGVVILAGQGVIEIEGAYTAGAVYSTSGQLMTTLNGQTTVSLPRGFYIVSIDGRTAKVAVY